MQQLCLKKLHFLFCLKGIIIIKIKNSLKDDWSSSLNIHHLFYAMKIYIFLYALYSYLYYRLGL